MRLGLLTSRILNGRGGTMPIFGMDVEHSSVSYFDYVKKMIEEELFLTQQIQHEL